MPEPEAHAALEPFEGGPAAQQYDDPLVPDDARDADDTPALEAAQIPVLEDVVVPGDTALATADDESPEQFSQEARISELMDQLRSRLQQVGAEITQEAMREFDSAVHQAATDMQARMQERIEAVLRRIVEQASQRGHPRF